MDRKRNELIELLKRYKEQINKKIKVERLILFGSRAYGRAKKNSDVDIVIISNDFEGEKSFKRPVPLYRDWDCDYVIDIICLTPKEAEKKKKQIGTVREAITEGIEI